MRTYLKFKEKDLPLKVFFNEFLKKYPTITFSRSVEPAQRSLALGFQTMLIRALGTVPGPIVYGEFEDL